MQTLQNLQGVQKRKFMSNKQNILNVWRDKNKKTTLKKVGNVLKKTGKALKATGSFAMRRGLPVVGAAYGAKELYKNVPLIAKGVKGLVKDKKAERGSKKALKVLKRKASLSESPEQAWERTKNDTKHQVELGLITQEEADKVIRDFARHRQEKHGEELKY